VTADRRGSALRTIMKGNRRSTRTAAKIMPRLITSVRSYLCSADVTPTPDRAVYLGSILARSRRRSKHQQRRVLKEELRVSCPS
jgi:hypothetical protein